LTRFFPIASSGITFINYNVKASIALFPELLIRNTL
jgi:hypothetical protein